MIEMFSRLVIVWCFFQLILVVRNIEAIESSTEKTTTVKISEAPLKRHHDNKNNDENVSLVQVGTLQKFQSLGRAYTIPDNQTFEEYYETFLQNTPDAINKTSENFPKPYPVGSTQKFKISVENCSGIEIIFHVLDIDPIKDNVKLSIVTDPSNNNDKALQTIILTGKLKEALLLRALGSTEINFEFVADTEADHNYQGFLLTYRPFGEIPIPPTIPPDVTIPFDLRDSLTKYLVVDRSWDNITWTHMKTVLCNATNSFINRSTDGIISLESCHPENITFTQILKCQDDWPDSGSCLELNFAVTLFKLRPKYSDPFLEESNPKTPGGLYSSHLKQMWNEYGKECMEAAGYPEYQIPDKQNEMFLWASLGIGTILIVFIVLVALYHAGYFGGRWSALEENDSNDIKVQQDIDITMFPSPDQVVPVLFPTNTSVGYSGGYDIDIGYSRSSENYVGDSFSPRSNFEYYGDTNKAFIADDDQSEIIYEKKLNDVSQEKAET